jgi:DNA polymerase
MIIGEAPGETEDVKGRPFIGKSGQLLRDALEANGIRPEDVYITNAVKCRPPKNRKPKPDELKACSSWLRAEIHEVKPERIICLGDTAAKALFGAGTKSLYRVENGVGKKGQALYREPNLTELRRRDDLMTVRLQQEATDINVVTRPVRVPVQVAYHPSAALRTPRAKSFFLRDIERLAEDLGVRQEVDQTRDYQEAIPGTPTSTFEGEGFTVAIDTEYEEDGSLVCFSWSTEEATGRVMMADAEGARLFLKLLLKFAGKIVLHNAKADVPAICTYLDIPLDSWPWDKTEDTIVLAYNLGKRPLALKSLAENILGLKVVRLDEIRQKGEKLADVPREQLVRYSAQDADITLRLYNTLMKELCP